MSRLKKPDKLWNIKKVQGFVKVMGETGTQVFFSAFGLILIGLGIWLIVK